MNHLMNCEGADQKSYSNKKKTETVTNQNEVIVRARASFREEILSAHFKDSSSNELVRCPKATAAVFFIIDKIFDSFLLS